MHKQHRCASSLVLTGLSFLLLLGVLPAAGKNVPFYGIVISDQATAHNRAAKHYVTGYLQKGELVRVEQVLQGWYKIQPPPSCYSFINKAFVTVKRQKGQHMIGIISKPRAAVKAVNLKDKGNSYYTQRSLTQGQSVTIIGEYGGYHKIIPPEGAYVWTRAAMVRQATQAQLKLAKLKLPTKETQNKIHPEIPKTPDTPAASDAPETSEAHTAADIATTPVPIEQVDPHSQTQVSAKDSDAPVAHDTQPTEPVKATDMANAITPHGPADSIASKSKPLQLTKPRSKSSAKKISITHQSARRPALSSRTLVTTRPTRKQTQWLTQQQPAEKTQNQKQPDRSAVVLVADEAMADPPTDQFKSPMPTPTITQTTPSTPEILALDIPETPNVSETPNAPVIAQGPTTAQTPEIAEHHPTTQEPIAQERQDDSQAEATSLKQTDAPPIAASQQQLTPPPTTPSQQDATTLLNTLEAEYANISMLPLTDQPLETLQTAYQSLASSPSLNTDQLQQVQQRLTILNRRTLLKDSQQKIAQARQQQTQIQKHQPSTAAHKNSPTQPRTPRTPQTLRTLRNLPNPRLKVPRGDAIGWLVASQVYNGIDQPRLYRLVDPATRRTLVYVKPGPQIKSSQILGQLVSIQGKIRWDGQIKAKVIQVNKIQVIHLTITGRR